MTPFFNKRSNILHFTRTIRSSPNFRRENFRKGINVVVPKLFSVCLFGGAAMLCQSLLRKSDDNLDLGFDSDGPPNEDGLPDSVDWRDSGAVSEVGRQFQCGCCTSWAVTGAVEGAVQISTGKMIPLSPQELVDCDRYGGGCRNGCMPLNFEYIRYHGITSLKDYPYVSYDTELPCLPMVGKHRTYIAGHREVRTMLFDGKDDVRLMKAIARQPIAVGIVAGEKFLKYKKGDGVFKDGDRKGISHAVLFIGYGHLNGEPCFLLKNSHGRRWGYNGYMFIAREAAKSMGVLSLLDQPTYPTLEGNDCLGYDKKDIDNTGFHSLYPLVNKARDPSAAVRESKGDHDRIQAVKEREKVKSELVEPDLLTANREGSKINADVEGLGVDKKVPVK